MTAARSANMLLGLSLSTFHRQPTYLASTVRTSVRIRTLLPPTAHSPAEARTITVSRRPVLRLERCRPCSGHRASDWGAGADNTGAHP
jgi:hypothetical protein